MAPKLLLIRIVDGLSSKRWLLGFAKSHTIFEPTSNRAAAEQPRPSNLLIQLSRSRATTTIEWNSLSIKRKSSRNLLPEFLQPPPIELAQYLKSNSVLLLLGLLKKFQTIAIYTFLIRTMQTAVGVFGGDGYTDRTDVPPLMVADAGNSNRSAISSLDCPPILAVELCREHLVESNEDIMWKADVRETKKELAERGMKFLNWLCRRKEREIAVVTHSGFLFHTLSQFGKDFHPSMKDEICKR